MAKYDELKNHLNTNKYNWVITGVAGFIGSHLLENLLNLNQNVTGIDNYSTGDKNNLEQVHHLVGDHKWSQFTMVEGDVRDFEICKKITEGADYILHQAALGSVPRSIEDPLSSHNHNVNGHFNMIWAGETNKVKKIVYASSSSVYGDDPELPKVENQIGEPLSPYAVTKRVNEMYAKVFNRVYSLPIIGTRYFNVFGSRQNPDGPYAAVIPRWTRQILQGEPVKIFGDGETSRDFCYIQNVVQANLLAATTENTESHGEVINVAVSDTTSLTHLFEIMINLIKEQVPEIKDQAPVYEDFRPGDIRHSFANITKAQKLIGYEPTHNLEAGLREALDWYIKNLI